MKMKIATLLLVFLFPFLKEEKVEPPKQGKIYPRVPHIEAIIGNAIQGGVIMLTKDDTLAYHVLFVNDDKKIKVFEFNFKKTFIPIYRYEEAGIHQIVVLDNDSNIIFSKSFDVTELVTDTNHMTYTSARNNSREILFELIKKNSRSFELPDSFKLLNPLDLMILSDTFGTVRFFEKYNEKTETNDLIKIDFHRGIDLRASIGTPVKSVFSGQVVDVTNLPVFGKVVVINHGSDVYSFYLHLSKTKVKIGDEVLTGQVIALSGTGGTGPHLHLSIDIDGIPVNFFTIKKMFDLYVYKVQKIDRPRNQFLRAFFCLQIMLNWRYGNEEKTKNCACLWGTITRARDIAQFCA